MAPKKNQKMSLGTFLQDDSYGSWADEMEDMPLPSGDAQKTYGFAAPRRDFNASAGVGAYEQRGYSVREELPLPDKPPYTAHLANLSFDVTQDDIRDFFRDCDVTNIRIVEDKLDRKPKGFGYVEYGSLDGLKAALNLSGTNMAGRSVRISVADPPKDRPEQTRDFGDWSRKGPLPDLPQNQRRVSERTFSNRGLADNASDAGSERGGRRPFGGDRPDRDDGKIRDFSTWERKGPLSPAAIPDRSLGGAGRQPSNDFRRNSPSWGEARSEPRGEPRGDPQSQEGSRPPRGDRPIPPREPTAAELDTQWRTKMRSDPAPKSPEPETSVPSSPVPAAGPATRPRLNLQKRTVSEAVPAGATESAGDAKASPFGAARPVDTAAKEREVEEKREEALRLKKEADDKARAEKAEDKRLAREKSQAERTNVADNTEDASGGDDNDNDKENDQENAQGSKIEVLRRKASGNNDTADGDDDNEDDEEEAPAPDRDTAVKPKEVTRPITTKPNGTWRKSDKADNKQQAKPETAALEEDGWSTVSKSKKQPGSKRAQPTRAIAS